MYIRLRNKNHICNQWEQYYRRTTLKSYPIRIQLPTGTRCNINCKFCTERSGASSKEYHYKDLSFSEFLSLVDNSEWHEALSCTDVIDLYGWGEPLVNPDYEKIFDFIKHSYPGLGITISTNGILFSQKWSEKILPVNNSEVNFSVNAATKKTFYELTGSSQFERIVDNISTLTSLREKQRTKNPFISLSYVATTKNIEELVLFVDLAADLKVDTVLVQDVMIFNTETKKLALINEPDKAHKYFELARKQAEKRKVIIDMVSFEPCQQNYTPSIHSTADATDFCIQENENIYSAAPGGGVPSPFFKETDCFDPWERFMISANGEVFPCCRFQNIPGISLGNVNENSFLEIWNGPTFKRLRQTVNSDSPPEVCAICPIKSS